MTTAKKKKKAPAKRAARKAKRRLAVQRLGLLLKAACELANELMPEASGADKKAWVVSLLNKKIDIPVLNEDQEEIVFDLMVDIACDLMFGRYKTESYKAQEELAALLGGK
tara:strand:- start:5212 stop:5544 length:333 start_codon:yes stop_codon:yes gene_type:complete